MRQLPLRLGSGPVQAFDNFVVGANAAAVATLSAPGSSTAPIYLWGAAGAGKTHLLRARSRGLPASGGTVTACDTSRPLPWPWEDGCQLLVLDACDAYDAAQQHAAFSLFVEAADASVPVVAAGRLPPVDLPVREDLRTRLGWGLVFQLQPLSEPEVRAALTREADRRGLLLSREVLDYLFSRYTRDLGSLMAWLDALDDFSLAEQRAVTVPLLKRMLAQNAAEP